MARWLTASARRSAASNSSQRCSRRGRSSGRSSSAPSRLSISGELTGAHYARYGVRGLDLDDDGNRMNDDLFTPTVVRARVPKSPPWRPDSIVYPAFFGGPLAAMVLGLLNGKRLDLAARHMAVIAAAGSAAIVARFVLTAATEGDVSVRLLGSIAGALVWGTIVAVQRRPFRAFTFRDGEPARLVGPGLAAAIGCGLLEAVVLSGVLA
jgi:hypothetical protein